MALRALFRFVPLLMLGLAALVAPTAQAQPEALSYPATSVQADTPHAAPTPPAGANGTTHSAQAEPAQGAPAHDTRSAGSTAQINSAATPASPDAAGPASPAPAAPAETVPSPAAGTRTSPAPPPPAPAEPQPAKPQASNSEATAPHPAAVAPEPLTEGQRREIKSLLRTLTNDEDRAELVNHLQTLLKVSEEAPPPARSDWLSVATQTLGLFSTSVLGLVSDIREIPDTAVQLFANLSDPTVIENATRAALMVAAVLAAALAAEGLVKLLLVRPRRAVEARDGANLLIRGLWLGLRTVLDIIPIMVFAAVAFGVLAFVDLTFLVRLAVVAVINANVLGRVLIAAGRAVLAPNSPRLRLLPLDSESAAYGFLWVRRFTYTTVYGYFLLRAAWILGLSSAAYLMLMDLLAFIITGLAVVLILQIRKPVAQRLRELMVHAGHMATVRHQIADVWHVFAIAYVITVYIVWAADIAGGLAFIGQATVLSLITILAARLLVVGLYRAFEAVFRLNEEVRAEFPHLEARANRYLPVLRQGASSLITVVTLLVLLEIWGAQPFEWLATQEGQNLLGRAIAIFIVAAGTFIAWEVGVAFADRLYEANPNSTRLKTLLPFLQNGFRIILITIAGLMVLSEIGVNIAPLLAGASVFALAVGFGAQTMVKDVITGIFILMEDTLSVGDVVELGSHTGLVEKITVRTAHLRDFDGNLHSLPFGEMQIIKNMSKQFAYAVVDVNISYRENVDDALAVMQEVAKDMSTKGPLADTIIGPFELMGVEGLLDSAVWLRGRFKTRPLGQWNVKREFYRRIKAAFDARGIEIPFPHQTIYFGTDKNGHAPPVHLVQDTEPLHPPRKASVVAAARAAAQTPGPLVEEHPGAREHQDADTKDLLTMEGPDTDPTPPERAPPKPVPPTPPDAGPRSDED